MKHFRIITLIFAALVLIILSSCQTQQEEPKAKYVFLFIGDGMGIAQVTAAEAYQAALAGGEYQHLVFSDFPSSGFCSTFANNRFITGSAAAGTSLATGYKTNIGRISMDANADSALVTIAEKAKGKGMKVGILSSVSIDHATPAVFYAHQPSRSMYHEISLDLASSNFDFYGGGGLKMPVKDDVNAIDLAVENGFVYINDKASFRSLQPSDNKILFINPELTSSSAMYYSIDQPEDYITLAEITGKAIEYLDNENGFFMMVEGGKIDWLCHANDAGAMVREVIDFADAVEVAFEFYRQHPEETMIIVTADHETGGLGLGYSDMGYENHYLLLDDQKTSGEVFNSVLAEWKKENHLNEKGYKIMLQLIEENFGIGGRDSLLMLSKKEAEDIRKAFMGMDLSQEGEYEHYGKLTYLSTLILAHKVGLGWTSQSHTAVPVPIYATGVNATSFSGKIDNTDIPKIIWDAID